MREIVDGVVRDCDLVAKFKIAIFFPSVFVGADSRKSTLAKFPAIYTVVPIP